MRQPLLVMTRVIAAPRDAVFADWIRPERLARWWDPERHVTGPTRAHVDICELVAPERIVFTWGNGRVDTLTLVTVTLHADGDRTHVRLEQAITKVPCTRGQGPWCATFDRLRDYLALHGATP